MSVKVAYFAHDLSDPAVSRRIRMLTAGGASVQPFGFRRSSTVAGMVEDLRAIDLGRTADGMLARRALSVSRALSTLHRHADQVRGADVVLARNLEMLMIASRARKLYAPTATLVYECLDIHRMLLSNRISGALLRSLESRLWQQVDLLLTSSPAFIRNYFMPRSFPARIRLVENKVVLLGNEHDSGSFVRPPLGPPWRIGWFGAIRCRKSLEILGTLASASRGAIEIVLRGRPSKATFPNFEAEVTNLPHVRFGGSYRYPDDLSAIYGEVHFTWAVDYYESGQNSAWLLPNRIYEGSLYGAVPIALRNVETGRWLFQRDAGALFDEPLAQGLKTFFQQLDAAGYIQLVNGMKALRHQDLIIDRAECRELVETLCQPAAGASSGSRVT
jgi:succinoglycan biosynthesis protein ExoL